MHVIFEFFIFGLGLGGIYGLMSLGLVLVHRVSKTINFAHGAIAMAGTYLFWEIHKSAGFWVAYPIALIGTSLLGAIIYLLVMRPLRSASPVSRLLATLGVLATITAVVSLIFPAQEEIVGSSLPSRGIDLFAATVPESQLWVFGIGAILAVLLAAVYRYSRYGLATSAVAESSIVSEAMGLSPDLIATLNWALASGLAVTAGVLLAPTTGLDVTEFTQLLVFILAASLVGNMSSFSLTFVAALAIGIAQSEIEHFVSAPGWPDVVPLVVALALIGLRGRVIPKRGEVNARPPAIGTGKIHPVVLGVALSIAVALIVMLPVTWVGGIIISLATVIILTSMVVVTGLGGQLSLCQFAFAGIGAYIAGRLVAAAHLPFVLALIIAVAASVPAGLIVGVPALRARGTNLAVATLLFAFALEGVIFDSSAFTGGDIGTQVGNPKLLGISMNAISDPRGYALVCLVFALLTGIAVVNLRRSSTGRRLLAIRSNERAAAALGVPVAQMKTRAFMLGSAIAALGGVLFAFSNSIIEYTIFTGLNSVNIAAFGIVGSVGYVIGPYWGSVLEPGGVGTNIGLLFNQNVQDYLLLIGGVLLILVVVRSPDGLAWQTVKDLKALGQKLAHVFSRVSSYRAGVTRPVVASYDADAAHKPASPVVEIPVEMQLRRDVSEKGGVDTGVETAGALMDVPVETEVRRWLEGYNLRPGPLSVRHVSMQFGGHRALDDVSLEIRSGEILGVIGPNGAGKSTLIEAIMGFERPLRGTVSIGGLEVTHLPVEQRAELGIALSFQSLELFEDMTVRENLVLGEEGPRPSSMIRDLVRPSSDRVISGLNALSEVFHMQSELDLLVRDLPYGRRRVAAIARCLLGTPSFLLLDEPVSGMGRSDAEELAVIVSALARHGVGVLLVEHDIEFVMSIAERVVVLDFGRVIAEGSPVAVRRNADVIRAYLGELSSGSVEDPVVQ